MDISNFSMEFGLSTSEIQKLNKMYFKHLYKERILLGLAIFLFLLILFTFSSENDFVEWTVRSLVLIIFFLVIQYFFVNSICKIIFRLAKRLSKSENFIKKYRLNFTNSLIYVHSPLGRFAHKWTKIEKAILTKDFFFLYVKERNGYIITIANKCNNSKNMGELVAFVEQNVTKVFKI
jgi:hypothetical protein